MIILHPLRQSLVILAVALGFAGLACALPDRPYQRWQLLDGTIHGNLRWMYERIHFDPTPIDIAILGPSRTDEGVDAPRLGRALAARGLPANVVNFSLPENGRNINDVVFEELLTAKHPKLVILGVIEKPKRYGHAAFKYIAPSRMILNPGYWADVNYLSDLAYLPFRQMRLFLARYLPTATGLDTRFNPRLYRGSSIDTTGTQVLPDGTRKEGEAPAPPSELARGVHKLEATMHPPLLGPDLADVEFGDERYYVRRIAQLAKAHGVGVIFLFIPYYNGPDRLQELPLYRAIGPVMDAGFLAPHADLYADYGHLTRRGAQNVTDWMTGSVVASLIATAQVQRPQ